jgi:SAM-dependent methyltransferase
MGAGNGGVYVQYGCHFCAPDGWMNFDASPTLRFERTPVLGRLYTKNGQRFPENVRYGDILRGLPVADGTVDGLYASHVLEHLSRTDCERAVRNSYRMLRPGGIFRLIVPDLEQRARSYLAALGSGVADANDAFMKETYLGQMSRPRGLFALATKYLGNASHLWMWDYPSMAALLRKTGFSTVRRCAFGDCADPMFARVESEDRFVSRGITEVAIEAVK